MDRTYLVHPSQGIDSQNMIGALLSRINYLEKVTIGDLKARVKELEAELEDAKPKLAINDGVLNK